MKGKPRSVSERKRFFTLNLSQNECGYDHYKVSDLPSSLLLSFIALLVRAFFFRQRTNCRYQSFKCQVPGFDYKY